MREIHMQQILGEVPDIGRPTFLTAGHGSGSALGKVSVSSIFASDWCSRSFARFYSLCLLMAVWFDSSKNAAHVS